MIVDIKYHIASLAAVFLALGIGILIGMTMLGSDAIVQQQEKLTERLETDLTTMREEAKVAQGTLKENEKTINNYQTFSSQALPLLIQNRLEGLQVAIVETNTYAFSDEIINNFNLSGATVTSVTTIKNIATLTKEQKSQIINYLGLKYDIANNDLVEAIALEIAQGIETGENFDFLTLLEDLEIVDLSGEYGIPLNSAVIIGGSQEKVTNQVEAVDLTIIDHLASKNISVFGVEKSDIAISYMEEYQKAKIPTVDNVDTSVGQVALIWAMNQPGNYGIKETAKSILPQDQKVAQ